MSPETIESCTSFEGSRRIASGTVAEVAARTKRAIDQGVSRPILIFDDATGQPVEIDFRGTVEAVLSRLPSSPTTPASVETEPEPVVARGPGRPKLGVVAREVTLLPRHWEWLNDQPGGASVALRKLVEAARKASQPQDRIRLAREAAYRFMTAIAGDFPGFEEANRALFAGDAPRFAEQIAAWPPDVREHAHRLASAGLENGPVPCP
jgi:hypothetical protein